MPKSKPPHPADLANAEVLAQAVRFDVALFLGAGRYAKASAATLAEAEAEAARLANAHAASAKPLIYGVTADGRSALVASPSPRGRPAAGYASRFSAQRGARSVLGTGATEGRDFATAQDGEAWSWTPVASPAPTETALEVAAQASRPPAHERAKAARSADRRAALLAEAQAGRLPPPPDFSAPTHARFRAKLAALVAMVEAGDAAGPARRRHQPGLNQPQGAGALPRPCGVWRSRPGKIDGEWTGADPRTPLVRTCEPANRVRTQVRTIGAHLRPSVYNSLDAVPRLQTLWCEPADPGCGPLFQACR